jgi:hypothetical protein
MKTVKIIIGLLLLVTLASCQRSCERLNKQMQTSDRFYHIEQYSGGVLINVFEFSGILNDSENSDGYYFYDSKNRLVELSGDLLIISTKDKYMIYNDDYNAEKFFEENLTRH